MGLQAQFRSFKKTISLTQSDPRLSEVREKRLSIDKAIKSKFKEKGWGDAPTFLQGSYATGMAIVPLDGDFDIDVAVTVPADTAPESPIPIKKAILEIFEDRGLSNANIKRPCVTAQYMKDGEPKYHLDYPVYSVDNNEFFKLGWGKPTSPTADKKWSEGDPKGLVEWTKNTALTDDEDRSQYRCVVRYLKRWRDQRYTSSEMKPYSIGLTIMVRECYVSNFNNDGEADDLASLIGTIESILNRGYFTPLGDDKYDLRVDLPKEPYNDVFKDHGSVMGTMLHRRLKQLKSKLLNAKAKTSVSAACKILAEENVFGPDFPIPKDNGNGKNFKKTIAAGAVGSPQGA